MENKTYLFDAIYGFEEQALVLLIEIRTIEKRILKNIKGYLTKNVPDPGSEKISSRIQGVKKNTGSRLRNTELFILNPYHLDLRDLYPHKTLPDQKQ
jgi:hypothetical protein